MIPKLLPLALLFLSPACFRDNVPVQPMPVTHVGHEVIVSEFFSDPPDRRVNWDGLRIGGYFDFSRYDSLVVTFEAGRVPGGQAQVPLSLKIGPTYYVRAIVSGQDQAFEYHVLVRQLAKPQSAALTFIVQDTVSSVLLSNVLVVGWYTE